MDEWILAGPFKTGGSVRHLAGKKSDPEALRFCRLVLGDIGALLLPIKLYSKTPISRRTA